MSGLEAIPDGFLAEGEASRLLGLGPNALGARRLRGTAPEHVLVDGRAFYDAAVIAAQATGPRRSGPQRRQGPVSQDARRQRWVRDHGPAWKHSCTSCGAPAEAWSAAGEDFEAVCRRCADW